jgi:BMFP domain-containing protein YqiC
MKDLLLRAASKPAGRVVEAPVRELVQEALQQGGFVDRAELDAVRKQLTQANAAVADLNARVDALASQLQSIQDASDQHATAAQAARADAAAARAELQALQAAAASAAPAAAPEAAPAAPEPEPEPAPAPESAAPPAAAPKADDSKRGRPSLTHKGCKVADCNKTHRSKGFCSRHYQQWRRGTLAGFVAPEGYVNADGAALRVNTKLQGSAFTWDGSALQIDGASVDFEALD